VSLITRVLNFVVLAGIIGMLLIAFWQEFARGEIPCALCLTQRAALAAAGVGFMLNARFGSSEIHYGIAILSSLAGAAAAGYQALHAAPGATLPGPVVLGLHFHTWMFLAFVLLIAFCGVMLFIEVQFLEGIRDARATFTAQALAWLFVLAAFGNAVTTLLLCGMGPCAEQPSTYELPWKARGASS
jgi:disulfide bond formation protein DsbB